MIFTKISNYGTTHPVVARLAVQTHELLQWADLPKEKKDQVYSKYDGAKNRLLKCHEAYERLCKDLDENMEAEIFNADGTLKRRPHLIGLEGEVETILYEAKNYLRNLLEVLAIFFGADFDEASYFFDARGSGSSKLVKWSAETFGEGDPFTTMLASEQVWIEELIRKRNAVEHPDGHSGTLYVHNFERITDNKFAAPTWHRNDMPRTGVFADIETILDNLLTLAEDLLVSCVVKISKYKIVQFVEIPSTDRNPNCPMRIVASLREGILPTRS